MFAFTQRKDVDINSVSVSLSTSPNEITFNDELITVIHMNENLTNEIAELLVVFWLSPFMWPADHHSVVLQTPQASSLNQMGCPVPQIRGDHHLREAFHLLCLHKFTQSLQISREENEEMTDLFKY